MSTLPDFTALGETPTPTPAGGVATIDPGQPRYVGLAGQAMSGAGRDLEQASSIVAATNDRQDQIVAQDAVNKLAQVRINAEFDPNSGFRSVKGSGAVGQQFVDDFDQKFGDASTQLRTNLQNDNQRRAYDRAAEVQSLQFKSALLQHQARETDAFNDKTADDTLKLSLRTMAQDPTNELTFQTGLAQINGTIDSVVKRKGLPAATAAEIKATYLDSAYTTRILSVMQGVPGAVQANPYAAEKMFEQVRDQLGPQSQVHLGYQVQKAVQMVQQRDTAKSFIFGSGATSPSTIAPAATGNPLQAVVMQQESGGQRFDAQGNLLTSPAGAQGEMQVMPDTARNPGFGVRPAQDNSPEELARVGRDYLGAMTARYNDPALVLASYNAGPGQVDKWIAKFGDPRTGQIDAQTWAQKIPFAETRDYVVNGLKKLNAAAGNPGAPVSAPTANQLKGDLYARVQAARTLAEQQYPGDTAYADGLAARVESYGRLIISNQQAAQAAANDTMQSVLSGSKPDGSDAPQTFDQFYSNPAVKAAWEQATPEARRMYQQHFANPSLLQKSDPKLVNDLTQRVFLPDSDPRKITEPGQLYEFMGKGLVYNDLQHLSAMVKEANTPEGSPFLKQVAQVKNTGRDMLKTSMSAFTIAHPELAEEAAYRFGLDLDSKIKAARAAGKDPQALFTPGGSDYVLDPSRVAAFMPTQAQLVAMKAAASAPRNVVPRLAGETPAAYLARVSK